MSSDASAPARDTADGPALSLADVEEYDEMLGVLDTLLDEALRKVEEGRVYDAENERIRIKWIRIAKDVVAEKRKVKSERDLEMIQREIEELKTPEEAGP
jgi:PHD/YefM family antitoxin component YafN of YafNO toxin-antitoxin module